VTDEELNGTDMVDELLGKRQCVFVGVVLDLAIRGTWTRCF
jgi:hypothetical protein